MQLDATWPPSGPPGGPARSPGDGLVTALLGLLDVELRRRGRCWRVVERDRVEVALVGEPWPGRGADLRPLRTRMAERPKADWPDLVEGYAEDLCAPAGTRPGGGVAHWSDVEPDGPQRGPAGPGGTDPAPGPAVESAAATAEDDEAFTQALAAVLADPVWAADSGSAQWDRIADSLRVRVLPTDPGHPDLPPDTAHEPDAYGEPDLALRRPVADGLVEAVVAERPFEAHHALTAPHSIELCTRAEAATWQVSIEAVFARARANTRADPAPQSESFDLDGAQLTALFGPSHYTAAHALWLPEYLAADPCWREEHGALCVIPHRHLVVAHVIESAAVADAAGTLLRFASRLYETSPGPISDQLYWWQGGALTRLPSDCVGQTLQLFPTERFADLLRRLRGDG